MAISPDGRWLGLGGSDGRVRVCDASTGQVNHSLTAHADNVFGLTFTADSLRMATGSRDGKIRIWDPLTGSPVQLIEGVGDVRRLSFSPDGELLAAMTFQGFVKLWKTEGWTEFALHHARAYNGGSIQFSPDGQTLAVAAGDKLQLWDPATGEVQKDLTGHRRGTTIGAFSADGRTRWPREGTID